MKVGICGLGEFGPQFIEYFQKHPDVDEVVVADLVPSRRQEIAKRYDVARTFSSLEELCESDIDAIAIFTQRWTHVPLVVKALKAGKHVYSAVPAAITLEELKELVETVKETGLTYMMGETSYYRPQTIYCRERFAKGDFGEFVYGEGQYYHDMSHFYWPYMSSGVNLGYDWKEVASFPPMLYPTHSASHILGVTFRRMTKVCCFGFVDHHEDGIFRTDLSKWRNNFSDESALFRTSDGGMARINEFRRTGAGESRMSILGTLGAYEEQAGNMGVWTNLKVEGDLYKPNEFFKLDYENTHRYVKINVEDVSHVRNCSGVEITEKNLGSLPREYIGRKHLGVSTVHHVERLPKEFVGLRSGHAGSHLFLVVDFVEACITGKLPPNNVWMAARYNAPGIVAHQSAMRGGEVLEIPDFGMPPANLEYMDPLSELKE